MSVQLNPVTSFSNPAPISASNAAAPGGSGDAFAQILASLDGATEPASSPAPQAMPATRISNAEQLRKFGYTAAPDTIGKYQHITMDLTGEFDNIAATGSYVVADMVRGGKTLSQHIYDPNGRFVMAVNPLATGAENVGQRDVLEELVELQQQRHGTWEQAQSAAEADFGEHLAFLTSSPRAESDPAWVNRGLRHVATELIATKSRVPTDINVISAIQTVPERYDARDMLSIVSTANPLQALKAATAEFYTSGIYRPAGEIPTNLSTVPTMTTSNGYKVAYVADNDHHAEAIAGRLFLTTDDGYLMRSIGTTPEQITKTLDTYGVGRVTTDPVSFMTNKPVHNHSVGTRASELNSAIAQALSSWAGFSNPYAGTSFLNARFMSNS
jgi:hypothetical protein